MNTIWVSYCVSCCLDSPLRLCWVSHLASNGASLRMCHKNTPRRILPSGVCISPRHIAASVFASCQVTRSLFIRWTCRSILSRSRRCSACARRCPRPLRLWLSSSWSSMICICNHNLHAALELVVSCVVESLVTNLAKLLPDLCSDAHPLNFDIDTWRDNLCIMSS